ncbi:MAG: alpha-amylase family glycosyl hydrolase [Candidatus Pacearchaeota archaeon]|nr:alpha-amylase family glycosyl hydrolase [Candidatus Pacearchaeota archaeon]
MQTKAHMEQTAATADCCCRSINLFCSLLRIGWYFIIAGFLSPAFSIASSPTEQIKTSRTWSSEIIYFVLIDRFADGDSSNNQLVQRKNPGGYHGGDLKGLTQHLDEISDLGATTIWINPMQKQVNRGFWAQAPAEIGTGSFEHWGFHGYWADDFYRMEPQFGTEADLKALVDAAHNRGIKVLLDVVFNHAGYQSQYEKNPNTRHWLRNERLSCDADPIKCQVGGLPDFRTEDAEVRQYLLTAHIDLAKRTGIDGFRIDTAKHIEHEFLAQLRARSRKELGNDFFLLGEVWGGDYQVLDEWFINDELDAGFDFSFRGNCHSYVKGKGRSIAFAAYLKKRHQVRKGYHLAHYLSSHDEPLSLYELGYDKNKFRLCVALQMTTLGIPVIYYGEEVARSGSVWPTNRKNMPWGSRDIPPGKGAQRDEALRDYYRKFISIRKLHPALSRGDYQILSTKKDPLLVYARHDDETGDVAIVAVNRTDKPIQTLIPKPEGLNSTMIRDALVNNEIIDIKDNQIAIQVPAETARLYLGM